MEIVKALADDADIDCVCVGGQTPLLLACARGEAECAEVLLSYGANRFAVDQTNKNAWDYVVANFSGQEQQKLLDMLDAAPKNEDLYSLLYG